VNTEEDFTRDPVGPPVGLTVVPYDPSRARENVRGLVTGALLLMLFLSVLAGFFTLWCAPDKFDGLMKLYTIFFTPLVALVGSSIGFYFGKISG
jgi:hypothetical protein